MLQWKGPNRLSSSGCSMFVCVCVCVSVRDTERERGTDGGEAYSDAVFLVTAN